MPIYEYRCGHWQRYDARRRVEESFVRYGMEMPRSVREAIEAAREGELPKELDE